MNEEIKFIRDLVAYKGLDDSIFGPFKSGEVASLPEEEAVWLVKEKLAERVIV